MPTRHRLEPSTRVRLTPDSRLVWREWEDATVLYHGASGDTHLLEPAAVAVLRSLETGPKRVLELEAALRSLPAGAAPGPEVVRVLLDRFRDLGIVETVESPSGDDEAV